MLEVFFQAFQKISNDMLTDFPEKIKSPGCLQYIPVKRGDADLAQLVEQRICNP